MHYEVSAGVIPFRRRDDRVEFLLLHSLMVRNPEAAWEFPKGRVEPGETEIDAALRELIEEATLTEIELLPEFRDQVRYSFRRGGREISKTVTFFAGEVSVDARLPPAAPTHEHGHHPREGIWFVWVTEDEARRRLFHQGMRRLLQRVTMFLHEHDRIQRRIRATHEPAIVQPVILDQLAPAKLPPAK